MSELILRSAKIHNPIRVDISESTTISDIVEAKGHCMYGLIVPSNFDGTQIKFQTSYDGVTFEELHDNLGVEVALTVAASKNYDLPTALAPWPFWRIVCSTAQTTTDTDFIVVAKG